MIAAGFLQIGEPKDAQFGGDIGTYKPPMIPINSGNQMPTTYTMPR